MSGKAIYLWSSQALGLVIPSVIIFPLMFLSLVHGSDASKEGTESINNRKFEDGTLTMNGLIKSNTAFDVDTA